MLVEVKKRGSRDHAEYFSDKVFVFRVNSVPGIIGQLRVSVSSTLPCTENEGFDGMGMWRHLANTIKWSDKFQSNI